MSKPNTIDTTPAAPLSEGTTRDDAAPGDIFAELEAKRIGKGELPQVKREPVTDTMSDGTVRTQR